MGALVRCRIVRTDRSLCRLVMRHAFGFRGAAFGGVVLWHNWVCAGNHSDQLSELSFNRTTHAGLA